MLPKFLAHVSDRDFIQVLRGPAGPTQVSPGGSGWRVPGRPPAPERFSRHGHDGAGQRARFATGSPRQAP